MFPTVHKAKWLEFGFPHAGGDVSGFANDLGLPEDVFPTQVGMFPTQTVADRTTTSFPHAGGDVSLMPPPSARRTPFSPRRWGCFHREGLRAMSPPVFPTQVGMFPLAWTVSSTSARFPHAGGDVSGAMSRNEIRRLFSPRRWGCFSTKRRPRYNPRVFPTQVGMFLKVK